MREGWKGAEKERGIMMLLPVISVLCSWVPILSSPFSPLSLHTLLTCRRRREPKALRDRYARVKRERRERSTGEDGMWIDRG